MKHLLKHLFWAVPLILGSCLTIWGYTVEPRTGSNASPTFLCMMTIMFSVLCCALMVMDDQNNSHLDN